MPHESPDLRPADPESAGRAAFGAEPGEREHDANGHYVHGPRLLPPPVVRLIGQRVLDAEIAVREKAPAAERRKLGRDATRAAKNRDRFLRALRGEFAPVRRSRSDAA